jgi:hypothetical protein
MDHGLKTWSTSLFPDKLDRMEQEGRFAMRQSPKLLGNGVISVCSLLTSKKRDRE